MGADPEGMDQSEDKKTEGEGSMTPEPQLESVSLDQILLESSMNPQSDEEGESSISEYQRHVSLGVPPWARKEYYHME